MTLSKVLVNGIVVGNPERDVGRLKAMAEKRAPIVIGAPFTGWVCALDQAPDPVFAQRMLGDGIAIDPLEGVLRAPCDATIVSIAASSHAITIEIANGAQLLLHIGIDTVALGGTGFVVASLAPGDHVRRGDKLIEFDLDAIAQGAPSLVTPIVVANAGYRVETTADDRRVEASDPLMTVIPLDDFVADVAPTGEGERVTGSVELVMAAGLHARPAGRIAAALKPLSAEASLSCNGRVASARSVVAMFTLGAAKGDMIEIAATGADAPTAFACIVAVLANADGHESDHSAAASPVLVPSDPGHAPVRARPGTAFQGVGASPGLGVGPLYQLRLDDPVVVEHRTGSAEAERAALSLARAALTETISGGGETGRTIAAAHRALLDDPELIGRAEAAIEGGKSAAFAWRAATADVALLIQATGNAVMIERIADMIDIERRLVALLCGSEVDAALRLPAGAIVIADEMPPSLLLGDDVQALAGIVTARGGPTSHAAILAAAAGVPMVVAAGAGVCTLPAGEIAIVDGDTGRFDAVPTPELIGETRARLAARAVTHKADMAAAAEPCRLADGTRIEVFANLASAADARRAVAAGAEGCGLLRTEFLFLDRTSAPTEAEQVTAYRAVAAALDGRPLIVRTLDVGADKPLPYLPQPREDNPALGLRGLRLSLAEPDLLATQLRAILTAVPAAQCRIMLPMVVDRDEYRAARAMLDLAKSKLGIVDAIALGVMIETPAAALLADSIAAEADFLSIGTNDLTQYCLAADRGNPAVAAMIDALHPAVLHLIGQACAGARAHGRWVGVCGGLAADPMAAAVLIGLGVTELSVPSGRVAGLKAQLAQTTLAACEAAAAAALDCATAREVRAILADHR